MLAYLAHSFAVCPEITVIALVATLIATALVVIGGIAIHASIAARIGEIVRTRNYRTSRISCAHLTARSLVTVRGKGLLA